MMGSSPRRDGPSRSSAARASPAAIRRRCRTRTRSFGSKPRELETPSPAVDGLPELEAVPVAVDAPAEAAVFMLHRAVGWHAHFAKLREHRVEVPHAVVDHHLLLARAEVVGVAREDGPDQRFPAVGAEDGSTPVLEVDAE